MRSLDEIEKSARDVRPFSNATIGHQWIANWCDRCLVDAPYRNGISPTGCPLLMVALLDKTPIEWFEQPDRIQDYTCIEARFPGGRGGEPRPKPEPPQMEGLFERPERAVRMYVQPETAPVVQEVS